VRSVTVLPPPAGDVQPCSRGHGVRRVPASGREHSPYRWQAIVHCGSQTFRKKVLYRRASPGNQARVPCGIVVPTWSRSAERPSSKPHALPPPIRRRRVCALIRNTSRTWPSPHSREAERRQRSHDRCRSHRAVDGALCVVGSPKADAARPRRGASAQKPSMSALAPHQLDERRAGRRLVEASFDTFRSVHALDAHVSTSGFVGCNRGDERAVAREVPGSAARPMRAAVSRPVRTPGSARTTPAPPPPSPVGLVREISAPFTYRRLARSDGGDVHGEWEPPTPLGRRGWTTLPAPSYRSEH